MVAVLLPTAALARFTDAVIVPFPEPDEGLIASQEALVLADQLPFDVMPTVWFDGSAAF